jgi:hypothetical protein
MISHKSCLLATILCTTLLLGCFPSRHVNQTETSVLIQASPTAQLGSSVISNDSSVIALATLSSIATDQSASSTVTAPSPITIPALTAVPTALLPTPGSLAPTCETMEPEAVVNVTGLSGVLAYVVPATADWQTGNGQSGIVGGTPLQSRIFPPFSNIDVFGFSPDGNWFAYTRTEPDQSEPFVYLLSDRGETITTPLPAKTKDTTLFWFMTWISNSLLMIQYNRAPTGFGGTYVVDSYAIFDAFTGDEHNELLETLSYWDKWTTPYFSPDMTRAVYVTDPGSPLGTSLVLWDTVHQSILWSRAFYSIMGIEEDYLGDRGLNQTVFWAPDGSRFVFTTEEPTSGDGSTYSSYLVDRDGVTERLLLNSPRLADVMVLGGRWSPDGRFIYYFYETSAVYDLASDQVVELCSNYSTLIDWSPDGSYLAYVGRVNQEPFLLLANVHTGEVSGVTALRDVYGLEWLSSEGWLTANPGQR